MNLEPKEIVCNCGAPATIERETDWCTKCGKRIYYSKKARTRGKINEIYFYFAIFGGITVVIYFFIELLLKNM